MEDLDHLYVLFWHPAYRCSQCYAFSSDFWASVADSTSPVSLRSPRLPIETCEQIIDNIAEQIGTEWWVLGADPWWSTMAACALTCKAWYHRCWFYLLGDLHIRNRPEVLLLHRRLRAEPRLGNVAKFATITGSNHSDNRQRLLHLGTFAVTLARHLHKLETITVRDAHWTCGAVRMEHVRYLGTFASLVSLCVSNVVFVSVAQLAGLISAVPALTHLRCDNLHCDLVTVSPSAPLNARGIRTLALFGNLAVPILEYLARLRQVAQLEMSTLR